MSTQIYPAVAARELIKMLAAASEVEDNIFHGKFFFFLIALNFAKD